VDCLSQAPARKPALAPQLARLGWTPRRLEDAQTAELRAALIEALAKFDDPATIEHALRAFDEDDSGKAPLPDCGSPSTSQAPLHDQDLVALFLGD